jgi:hypothetical protein
MFWKKDKNHKKGDEAELSPESLYMGEAPAKPPARRKPEAPVVAQETPSVDELFGSDLPPPRKKTTAPTPAPLPEVLPPSGSADDFLFTNDALSKKESVLSERPLPPAPPPVSEAARAAVPTPRATAPEPLPAFPPEPATESLSSSAPKPSSWMDRTGFRISKPIFTAPPSQPTASTDYSPTEDVPDPIALGSPAPAKGSQRHEAQEITLEEKPAKQKAPLSVEPNPVAAEPAAQAEPSSKKWSFGKKPKEPKQEKPKKDKTKTAKETKTARGKTGSKDAAWHRGDQGTPLQLFIGFLPEAEAKDAREYAFGVAERNATNPISALYGVFPYNGGFAYEVHEGGHGKSYLPTVIEYFQSLGPFNPGEASMAHIRTASRIVQVERTRQGLVAFLLPEKDETPQSEWLKPGKALKPAISLKKGMLGAGAGVFIMGAAAMIAAILIVPMLPKPVAEPIGIPPPMIPYHILPISQWEALMTASQQGPVGALKFEGGKWIIQPEAAPPAGPAPIPPPVPTPGGTP